MPPLPGMPMLGPDGLPLVSRLQEPELEALAAAGGGLYARADYRAEDTDAVLETLLQDAESRRDAEHSTRVWWEAFHWLLLPAALLLLFFSRREGGLVQLARSRD